MNREALVEAMEVAAAAINEQGGGIHLLERGGIAIAEVDLTEDDLASGLKVPGLQGYGLRLLRAGSNPGTRLELTFGGNNKATTFLVPGMAVKGGFKSVTFKRGKGCARVGKATFALLNERGVDFTEDLLMSAIGPVDLLGSTGPDGHLVAENFVTVAEDTDPAGANPVGSFDASGWTKLRIYVYGTSNGGNATSFELVPWNSPTYDGTVWCEQGTERIVVPDSDTSGAVYRAIVVPWTGRGLGYFAIRNLLAAARTGLGLIVQGLE